MFPVATTGGGSCLAFPDVCKTPSPIGVPIPFSYLAMAQLPMTTPPTAAKKVKVVSMPVLLLNSIMPMTSGNEAGTIGGLVSQLNMSMARPTKGSTKLIVEGVPAAYLTTTVAANGMNANQPMGIHHTPSQTKVFVAG